MPFDVNEITATAFGGTELAARSLAPLIPQELLDQVQIIPSRIRTLDPTKIRVLWLHDLPEDPESAKLKLESYRRQFHHLVFVSNWQYNRYQHVLGVPYDINSSIIEVGIEPAPVAEKPTDKVNLVYSTTPHRGLEILLPVFEELAKTYSDIHLDVFSSFAVYGWPQRDKEFELLFDFCRKHPQITYHGFQPNEVVRKHLDTAHILAYPSIWQETSCRSLVEAMSAQMLCVHPNFAALSDTSGGVNLMYQGDRDPHIHANVFYEALDYAIKMTKSNTAAAARAAHGRYVKAYADTRFNLHGAGMRWTALLRRLVAKFPTEESRALPVDKIVDGPAVFEYNVR